MLRIFALVFLFLIRLRFPPKKGFVNVMTQRYGSSSLALYRNLEKLDLRLKKANLDVNFLQTCKRHGVIPKFLFFKTYNHNISSTAMYKSFQFRLLNHEIKQKLKLARTTKSKLDIAYTDFKGKVNSFDFSILYSRLCQTNDTKSLNTEKTHKKKLQSLGISPDFKIDPEKVVINLSKRKLSPDESSILAHGPNFALPRLNANFIDHFLGFERLLHSLKSKSISGDSNLNWNELSRNISDIAHTSFRDFNDFRHTIPRLPPAQTNALRDLRSDTSITITRPDKGKGIVIMDKEEYISKVENILNDTTKFKVILEDPHKVVTRAEDKLANFLRRLKSDRVISNDLYKQLHSSGASPGVMYGLPKTHKNGTPVRPILAALGTYNYPLAKFLVPILEPLTRNDFTIKNSYDFASEITNTDFSHCIMASFDVESLFTNIPLDETIEIICDSLFEDAEKIKKFTKPQFKKLLNFAVKESPFLFNGKLYTQVDGVAMGSPLGPTFANCFLGSHEKNWLEQCPLTFKPLLYRRYVDDTFLVFKHPDHIPKFLSYLNNKHSNINFTVEHEKDCQLPFLDILLTRQNNNISTSIYRKPTFTGLGLNFLSFVPDQFKTNAIKTLLYRCYNICSDWKAIHAEFDFLTYFFQCNNFPLHLIQRNIRSFLDKTLSPSTTSTEDKPTIHYVVLPYYGLLSFSLRKSLHKLLKHCYPNTLFRFIFTNSRTIGSMFKHKESLPSSLISNIVYQFDCPRCKMRYVGETQRNLSIRVPEHRGLSPRTGRPISTPFASSIRSHSESLSHPFSATDFKILHKAKSVFDLLILESLYIKHLSPELNSNSASFPLLTFKQSPPMGSHTSPPFPS